MAFDPSIFLSLAFLFGIAAQFRAAEGYSFLRAVIAVLERKVGVVYAVVIVTASFSPFVLNDVLVLILTPVVIAYCKETGADVAPLLVAEITFTNIASSLTPLGNPQNILLWSASGISAGLFVEGTWMPLALSGAIAAALLYALRRVPPHQLETTDGLAARPLRPVIYLLGSTTIVFSLDFIGVASPVSLGLAFAFGFLFTSRTIKHVVNEFDFRGLFILYALVATIAVLGFIIGPMLSPFVKPVARGEEPYSALFFAIVSAVISNVPATQLVLSAAQVTPHVAPVLAVDAGLAGNFDPISSLANILGLTTVVRSGLPVRRSILLQFGVGLIAFIPALLF